MGFHLAPWDGHFSEKLWSSLHPKLPLLLKPLLKKESKGFSLIFVRIMSHLFCALKLLSVVMLQKLELHLLSYVLSSLEKHVLLIFWIFKSNLLCHLQRRVYAKSLGSDFNPEKSLFY